jgi:6-phosphogluconolactonase (cycloisomerase 2 family)
VIVTGAAPTAFGLDLTETFLFSAGTASGRLASYRLDGATGALARWTFHGREAPAAVLAVPVSR